jgi:hypothetical protein
MAISPFAQGLPHPLRVDARDAGLGVRIVRLDADLGAGEAASARAAGLQGQREEPDAHLLAGGEDHVHLALVGSGRHLLGQRDQPVGLPRHGRDDHHHVVARPLGPVLLHDERHRRPRGSWLMADR